MLKLSSECQAMIHTLFPGHFCWTQTTFNFHSSSRLYNCGVPRRMVVEYLSIKWSEPLMLRNALRIYVLGSLN